MSVLICSVTRLEESFTADLGYTFLNSYKSVSLLYFHRLGTFFGSPKGSVGCQYSMNPPSSAEITVSYRSLYWK